MHCKTSNEDRKQSVPNQLGLLSHTGINQAVACALIKSSKVCFAVKTICVCVCANLVVQVQMPT